MNMKLAAALCVGLIADRACAKTVDMVAFDATAPRGFQVNGREGQITSPVEADQATGGEVASGPDLVGAFNQIAKRRSLAAIPASSSRLRFRQPGSLVASSLSTSIASGVSRRNYFVRYRPVALQPSFNAIGTAALGGLTDTGCLRAEYHPKGLKPETEVRRAHYYAIMVQIACEVGVPVNLFDALVTQESGYNPYAISPKGAMGISQLMPDTARIAGVVNPWDIEDNLRGGARVLKMNLAEFGRYDLALAAYNAGAGRVRQKGEVPRIRETVSYVSSILADVRRQFMRDAQGL